MVKRLLIFCLLSAQLSFAQDVEMPKYLPEDPNQIPPLNHLNHIDTIREGLYRSTFGVNFGYNTPEYVHGFFDDEKMVIPFDYCELSRSYSNFMIGKKYNIGVGVIDSLNNVLIPFQYKAIDPMNGNIPIQENEYFRAYIGNDVGIINQKGEVLVPIKYRRINPSKHLASVLILESQDNKQGIANMEHSIITDCIYSGGVNTLNGVFLRNAYRELLNNRFTNTRWGSINAMGEVIVPTIYKSLTLSLDEAYLIAFDGRHSKIYNQDGAIVFQKDSVEIKNLVLGVYYWQGRTQSTIVQNNFTKTIPMNGFVTPLSKHFYSIGQKTTKENKESTGYSLGVKNHLGQEVLPIAFSKVLYSFDNLIFARKQGTGLYAAYDKNGNETIPSTYSTVATYPDREFAIVSKPDSDKFAVVDHIGHPITDFSYDRIYFNLKPTTKVWQIIATKGNENIRITTDGEEAALSDNPILNNYKPKYLENDKTATDALKGNYLSTISTEKDSIFIQYVFEGAGIGQRIIKYKNEKGVATEITQDFRLRITNVNRPHEIPWLWLWLKEPIAGNKKDQLKFLKENNIATNTENFAVKVKYPYVAPEIMALDK